MKHNDTKEIKAITELALDTIVTIKASQGKDYEVSAIVQLGTLCEVLAILRHTKEDHERDRVERLYQMRVKRGLL